MLDSAPTRTSYLSSHSSSSNSPRNQHALSTIRNAIASDSQRIRVQDESTGKSYELQLGKETPYPQNFGGDDSEDISVGDIPPQDKGSTSAKGDTTAGPVAPTVSGGRSNGTAAAPSLASGSTAPTKTTANGHGSSHRMLRLPMLVKSRASAAAGNDSNNASGKEGPKPVAVPDGSSKPDDQAQASTSAAEGQASVESKPIPKPTRRTSDLLRGPPKGPLRQGSTSSVGELHLQELNKRYHETLAANQSNEALKKTVSRDSSVRSSRDRQRIRTGSTSRSSLVPQNAAEGPSGSQQYTAPTRHYPVMSELPPSPPLENELEAGKAAISSDPDKTPLGRKTANNRASHLTVDTSAGRPQYSDRRMPSASSVASSAYHSAEEDFVDAPEDAAGKASPRTPTQRNPMASVLHSSPEQAEPLRLPPDPSEDVSPRTSLPPTFYLQRTTSDDSHQTSKAQAAPDLTRTLSSTAYLQPPAGINQPSSPSRRHRSLPPREKSSERNTTGSSTQSSESTASGGVGRRSSREKWQDQNQADGSTIGASSSTGAIASNASTTSKGPTAGTLRTGDAGFDEEVAKAEALIRKRKERTRREEEEKAAAAAEVGKKEAEQRDQQLRDRERERSSTIGGGGGVAGMPALMRAKSGLGRAGGGGPTTLSAAGQAAQAAKDAEEAKPAATIGNIINEGHVNYVLMYNMLTGIRIGVSRCQTRLKRPLRDEDYRAKHKFTFDIIGNELTPTAKYDFKFKDYAPWVFRELREYFHLDPADYLLSLTSKYILSELGSPGKSGSFFYFSRDYRFIIKTIRHGEHKFLRKILKDYHEHVKANPHTLLSRFYGLHRVKLPHGRKIHFVIMNNLFPPHRDIHETYDLKGSSLGREYPEEKAKTKKGATLKDLNWVRRRRELEFGPEKKSLFEAQLENDVALLKKLNIMDYSLLIGLHDVRRGNRENLRAEKLQVVQPEDVGSSGQGGQSATNAATSSNPPAPLPGSPASASASNHHHPHVPHLSLPHHHHDRATSPTSQGGMSRSESGFTVLSDEDFVDAELGPASPLPGSTESNPLSLGGLQSSSTSALPPSNLPASSSNPTSVQSPTTGGTNSSTNPKRASEVNAFVLRAAVRRSDLQALGSSSTAQLPAKETSERRHFLFYQEEGGFRSTNELNEPTEWIYYLGIIDLFTPYSVVKRGENWWKRLTLHDGRMVSSVPPRQYGNRFIQFLEAVVRPMKWENLPPGFDSMKKEEPLIPVGIGAGAIEGDEEKRAQEVPVSESKVDEMSMPIAATTEQGINEKGS